MTTILTKNRSVIIGLAVIAILIGTGIGSLIRTNPARAEDTALTATTPVTTTATTDTTINATPANRANFSRGMHRGANTGSEELLTGDIATKVTDAALKAFPGSTIRRIVKVSSGSVYEVHLAKTDGSRVRAYFDADYNLTSQEACPGGHGHQSANLPIN
ncbi:MAG: hypothetical protein WC734_00445 [Patescibacteria group bacterium]